MPQIKKPRGYLRRTFDAFLAARERQAEQHVGRVLLERDDAAATWSRHDRDDVERRIGCRL